MAVPGAGAAKGSLTVLRVAHRDGEVDSLDIGYVLGRLGCIVSPTDPNCELADQNGDGHVDLLDVDFVLARFATGD